MKIFPFVLFVLLTCFYMSFKTVTKKRFEKKIENRFNMNPPDTLIIKSLVFADFFSPNGDGNNDAYTILNIEDYPQNTFKVMNRWGEVVYYASPYKNDWKGISNSKGVLIDEQCPEGVYFFEFTDGINDQAVGKITLKR